jgi:hypothetical protein
MKERHDAKRIAREDEPSVVRKPRCNREHTAQSTKAVDAVRCKDVGERFGIGTRAENAPIAFKLRAEEMVVVDLAVPRKYNAGKAWLCENKWLHAARWIEQREATMRERDVAFLHESGGIGSAMSEEIAHRRGHATVARKFSTFHSRESKHSAHQSTPQGTAVGNSSSQNCTSRSAEKARYGTTIGSAAMEMQNAASLSRPCHRRLGGWVTTPFSQPL